MIVVTGAAGFIGANLVKGLNRAGRREVLAVDEFVSVESCVNLADCRIAGYLEKHAFLETIQVEALGPRPDAVLHCGACTDTMLEDDAYLQRNNFLYSKTLLDYCQRHGIPFIYASSAAVYGANRLCQESPEFEAPLNGYGAHKLRFDQYVRERLPQRRGQIVGLRYFNVYGERERHKGRMASYVYQMSRQYLETGSVRLFEGSGGYRAGEQCRDFVNVEDVVRVNLHFLGNKEISGVFNVGSGEARSFNTVAKAVINRIRAAQGRGPLPLEQLQAQGAIRYIPFPDGLRPRYQNFTRADISALRAAGYDGEFVEVEPGVAEYIGGLLKREAGAERPGIAAVGA